MTTDQDSIQPYLHAAHELFEGKFSKSDLQSVVQKLPPLDASLLDQIAQQAEKTSAIRPRLGWALTQLAYTAVQTQNCDVFLRSLSAWHLARACNHWTQPKRVTEAITAARQGFEELNEAGWLSACEWQENAQAWTKPNFAEAGERLQEALTGLEQAGFDAFVPECRLALAYAQILTRRHDEALENIRLSEEVYRAQGDALNQARCWLHQSSSFRRQGWFDEAQQKLEAALSVFVQANAVTDQGKAHYQIALGHLLKADNLTDAAEHFTKAAKLFAETDLDLWHALSINNLGSVHLINGQLKKAEEHYSEARDSFAFHEIQGSLADNLNDSGKLNVLMGKPALSIGQFMQCEAINNALGSQVPAAIAISNLGEAFGQLGRYQDALYHLERAVERLEPLQIYFRLATCEKYMAWIWSKLGQPQLAHEHLDKAAANYELADQKAVVAAVHCYRAATFFQQGMESEAIQALERSIETADAFDFRPQSALAKRLLGEALTGSEDNRKAIEYLEQAHAKFVEMGMSMEQAACLVAIGQYYSALQNIDKAQTAFHEALKMGEDSFPEIEWSAHVELGNLAHERDDIPAAIRHYRNGMNAFKQIRSNFLQPSLAGSYLRTPAKAFDRIISVVSKFGVTQEALEFIEDAKASTLLRNLMNVNPNKNTTSQELDDLKVEIDQLRDQLRVSLDELHPLQSAIQFKQKRELLRKKTREYDELKTKLERKSLQTGEAYSSHIFNIERFREKADSHIPSGWVALNFYMLEDEIVTVMITPQDCEIFSQPLTNRFGMALSACDMARRNASPPAQSDLLVLGKMLLPDALGQLLTSDTSLLIVPHKRLHQIPWSALQPGFSSQPLVNLCIPSVTPSLQGLEMLWERNASIRNQERKNGLVVGLSTFDGLHKELPNVKQELSALSSMLGCFGVSLVEEEATLTNLLKLRNEQGLSRFAWLHLATHFFMDTHTGRLSLITLSDGDIYLDQIRDLAPLPAMVSLSACNSNDSFLYEGDERVDLQTACFIAGANSVVGNSWLTPDQSAAELVTLFYESCLSGANPGKAVAHAQRTFIEKGMELIHWAGYVCAGVP